MSTDQITGTPSNVVLSGTVTYNDPVTITSGAIVTGQPAILAQDVRGIENDGTVAGTNTGIELTLGGSVTNVNGGTITGYKYGVVGDKNGAPATVINQGYIGATTPQAFYSPKAWGVRLNAGGTITNTGTIAGYEGIGIRNAAGSVSNAGTITAYDVGVSLGKQGGNVTNDATGTITSVRNFGVYIQGNGTVDNSGTISVTGYSPWAAVRMTGAGTVINHVNATISGDAGGGYGGAGVRMANYYSAPGTASVVDNAGTITGFWGVYFDYGANGTLTNESTGSIFGDKYGVQMSDIGTVINSGTITAGYYSGVRLRDNGTVINKAGGTIIGGTAAAPGGVSLNPSGVYIGGDNATLENAGTIISTLGDAVDLSAGTTNRLIVDAGAVFQGNVVAKTGAANTLELSAYSGAGTISGIGTQFQHFQTVTIDSGAQWDIGAISTATTVVNAGTVGAHSATGIELGAGGSVNNSGLIIGTGAAGYGVLLGASGTVNNEATGTITAIYTGVGLAAGGTITNAGTITATGTIGDGIVLVDGGSVNNTGSVGGTAYGVYLLNGGSVFNGTGGKIAGGEGIGGKITAGSATIENAGTITGSGGISVEMNANTNRLIVDAGAVFNGTVIANGHADTLELKAGGVGTINGLGDKYTGFQTVAIDSGATWTVAGTIAGFNGSTIQGFDTSDRLDLTDLNYTSNNSFSLSNADVLTIFENGTAVATIQLSGDFTGEFFHLTNDGNGGSYVTEDNNPVCYCRGTMIRTDRGEIAVEGLRIGDRVITASGQAKPIRWIGRRSYSGKFARSNPNILPVCFKAGSLARNVPHRDLWVSPEHAMFIDGVLIPARCLVNGDSVFQANRSDLVEYFHIELDRHDVIVADGALSESYADDDNRGRFHNAHEFRRLYPGNAKKRGALYCAPRLEDGDEVERVQIAITARALRLKWQTNRVAS